MKKDHILLIGDSWGCGEWVDHVITHGGIAQYLYEDGYMVSNLSQPGGAFSWLLWPLESFLKSNQFLETKKVIVFQTDITRDFTNDERVKSVRLLIEKYPHEAVKEIIDRVYIEFYQQLDELGKKFGVEFLILGGLTDVTANLSLFSNIRVAIPSMVNEFDPLIKTQSRLMSNQWSVLDELFGHKKQQLLELMEEQHQRAEYLKNNLDYYKDGFHPGREIHKHCYTKIKQYL